MSECKYCKNESYDRPWCPACAKKYFNHYEIINNNVSNNKTQEIRKENINKDKFVRFTNFYKKKSYNKRNYNFNHVTNNGIPVRSVSEVIIGNYLEKHKIPYVYEKELLCENGIIIHPDFYIKGPCKLGLRCLEDVYIEHWGMIDHYNIYTQLKYKRDMESKINEYKKRGITLICTYESDLDKSRYALFQLGLFIKLMLYKNNKINFKRDS